MASFKGQDIISVRDFSKEDLMFILDKIELVKRAYAGCSAPSELVRTRILDRLLDVRVASLFYEPSTRTRVSSELALRDLGIFTDGFSGTEGSSVKKGESLKDTVRMFQIYQNSALFIRHPLEGSARYAAEVLKIPVINCGDGANQHPTQTILDLFTIKECQGRLEDLTIALVGDLLYGRTTHSLLMGLSKFPNIHVLMVCPKELRMNQSYIDYYTKKTGREPEFVPDLKEAISRADGAYMTRIQGDRFPDTEDGRIEHRRLCGIYKLTRALIEAAHPKPNFKVWHPLPRFKENPEIDNDVDDMPCACWETQAENGLYSRFGVGGLILGLMGQDYQIVGEREMYDFERVRELPRREREFSREHYRLQDGTLIDHLERGKAQEVLRALGITPQNHDGPILPINNLPSTRYGLKDVVGISGIELSEEELCRISLVSQTATINDIVDGRVVRKLRVSAPQEISGLVACENTKCITHPGNYEHVRTRFTNLQTKPDDPLVLRCAYCEKEVPREKIRIL